jgi:hypothetical protein
MSSKTTPNWTQRPAEEYTSPSVVYTRKNTSFEDWKQLVINEIKKHQFEGVIRPLEMKHGWELDATPYSFVQVHISRARKIMSRTI